MEGPTPYPDLNLVLRELVGSIQAILRDNLVGAYLQGSFAVGDFDEHSDVDFIIVTQDHLSETEVAALQAMHARLYGMAIPWAQHLEGSYFPRRLLHDVSGRGVPLWFLDHGSRSLIQSDHCNTVVVRWVLRAHGLTLAGPPPATLIDPIPVAVFRQEVLATMRTWGHDILAHPERYDNRFYQTYIVLSYCRMLHDLLAGHPGSKRAGAAWAKANLDPSWAALIDHTWAGRPDPARSVRQPADPADFQATLAFIRYALDEGRRIAADARKNG